MLKWRPEEEKVLKEMVESKFDMDDIRKVLKSRSEKAVQDRCGHLGIHLAHHTPEIDQEAFKRLMKGVQLGSNRR